MTHHDLCVEIEELRDRAVGDLLLLFEFKAYTLFAYVVGAEHFDQHIPEDRVVTVVEYSDFASELGLSNRAKSRDEIRADWANFEHYEIDRLLFPNLLGLFEHFFFDLLGRIFTHFPMHLSLERKLEVRQVIEASDREELLQICIEKELNDWRYRRISDWFEGLQELIGFEGPAEEDVQRLAEAKATRDVLVHNAGIANEIYVQKSKDAARFSAGEPVEVDKKYFRDTWKIVYATVLQLSTGLIARLCESEVTEAG